MHPPLDAFFLSATDGGSRLCLHHTPPPGTPLRGAMLYLHPWTEEMNKSRRMAAMASRALAARGWAVLQIDLLGCGDSDGDFADATWEAWENDALSAAAWLRARHPDVPLWLWGLRSGALLSSTLLSRLTGPVHLLWWQPVLQGKLLLQQFLRLKAAAQLADGGGKAVLAATREALASGESVDIAGYTLSSALAGGLERARAAPPSHTHQQAGGHARWLVCLETSTQPDARPSPAMQAGIDAWQAAGWSVVVEAVNGPAFWQTTEIEDAPLLVEATVAAVSRVSPTVTAPSAAAEAR